MNKLFVIIPCFNEELNIGILIDSWMDQAKKLKDLGYDIRLYAIDDCSTDSTNQVIRKSIEKYSENVGIIEHVVNKNLCGGLNTAVSFFVKNAVEGDLLCIMDGDNTQNPKYIHSMIEKLESGHFDCVIASRYQKGSATEGLSFLRQSLSDLARVYYSIMLHIPGVRDYTCGYRVYTYKCIKMMADRFGTEPAREKTFACMMELLYKCHLAGARVGEVGFVLRYDLKGGSSKMNVKKTMIYSLSAAIRLRKIK